MSVVGADLALELEPSDPEDLRAAVAGAHARLRDVVARFGGTVPEPAQGPAVAVFGVPTGHEDDAQRAVAAAREACRRGLVRRAAVATGEAVVAGEAGTVTGTVFTRVHELLRDCAPGGVAVDDSTEHASRAAPRGARLIGRSAELAALRALYGTAAEERRPRFVLMMGDAGVGKSRLVEELLASAERGGAKVFRGRCPAMGEGVAHWVLREVLWQAAGIALDDSGSVAARKLADLAAAHRLDAPTVSALAVSAGIALSEHQPEDSAPESMAEEIALAWPALLSALAASTPVVVAIEDLHWAEAPLLDMLERIHRRADGPLLMTATARPEFAEAHAAWSRRGGMSQIVLEPLTAQAAHELVAELLPAAPEALRARVVELAEGNPFFIEELVRQAETEGELGMPDTVRALLAARIDSLPPAEKSALQHAAVVGRRFWAPALEPNQTGRPLPELLRALEARGLIVARPVSSLPGQRELWFSHGLTREVAYRSIPRGARARTHAAVAAWLERLAGDRRLEFIDVLAHHYEAAAEPGAAALAWPEGSPERERVRAAAVRALLDAGAAARMGLLPEARPGRHGSRALALAATDRERLEAIEVRARSFHAAVRGDEALATYLEAIELARRIGEHADVARLRGHAVLLCSRYMGSFSDHRWKGVARELVEEGLQEVDERSDTFEAGALLLARGFGSWRWRDGDERDPSQARGDIERALAIADAIGSGYLRTYALEALTWRVLDEGLCEAAVMGQRLLADAGSLSNRVEAHESRCVAAICFARAGHFERAREIAADTVRQAAHLSRHRALHAGASAAIALIPPGHFTELVAATERIVEFAEEEGPRICATSLVALAGRALALVETGRGHETRRPVELVQRHWFAVELATYGHPIAEMLRPVVGADATRRLIREPQAPEHAGRAISRLRASLPLTAQDGSDGELERAIAEARALAGQACAPALGHIADWAAAAGSARAGEFDRALAEAVEATARLAELGERYTADRLLAELLPRVPGDAAAQEANLAARRLAAMGAQASADLLAARAAR